MRPALRAAGLASALILCGCFGPQTKAQPRKEPDFEAARRRAEQAQEDPGEAEKTLTVAPETATPKAKVVGEDAAKGCTWIESEATVTVGENDSRQQVRAAAVAEARKSAMQDFLGVEVRSRSLDYQQEGLRGQTRLIENMLETTRLGRIMEEQLQDEGYRDLPGCRSCRYRAKIKTCLMPIADAADKGFRAELGLSRTRFVEGEEAKVTVTATRDCYVYLYDVEMDWKTSQIVPNDFLGEVRLKAGETWEYPSDEVRRRGVRLIAAMPDEKTEVSAETIRLIAAKEPFRFKLDEPGAGGYLGLLRRLNASNVHWAEDAEAFTIYKR